MPAPNRDESKAYWERFGFVGMDEEDDRLPHVSCTSDFIDLGLYDPAHLRRPALHFEVDDVGGDTGPPGRHRAFRRTAKCRQPLRGMPAAVLTAPEGTPILLAETA